MLFRFGQLNWVTVVLVVSASSQASASAPCHDSDGDGWADPEVATDTCPADNCPAYFNSTQTQCASVGDPNGDGVIDVLDVVEMVGVGFRNKSPLINPACAFLQGGTDINCDSLTDVVDVISVIDVAFRNVTENFCRPCECECFPDYCEATDTSGNLLPNRGSFERYCQGTHEGWYLEGGLVNVGAPGAGKWSVFMVHCGICQFPPFMGCEISNPQSGGIYSFAVECNAYMRDDAFAMIERDWTCDFEYSIFPVPLDSGWVKFEIVDTLCETDTPWLFFYLSGTGLFDHAVVKYLGQAAP